MRPSLGDPEAERYLGALIERARDRLDDRFVGAWLVNSAARGDYVPGRSDLDVQIGVMEPLDLSTTLDVVDALRHGSLPCPAPRLELVVYRRAVLRHPHPRPDWELNLNTGPAIDDHVGTDPSAEPAHWFVLDLSMAREAATVLAGPPLADLLGPISDALVREALRASAAWHEAHDAAAPNRVLNACRAWLWLETRQWSSKTEAAAWAIARGADEALLGLALARRRGESSASLPTDRVARFTGMVDRLIAAAGAR